MTVKMGKEEVIKHWFESAKRDKETAEILFANKRYDHCLFFCHLFLEKALKALVIKKTDQAPPWTHDLLKLARVAELTLSASLKKDFQEINSFNIRARYNDVKLEFYKKATKRYTGRYFQRCQEIYQWLKKQI